MIARVAILSSLEPFLKISILFHPSQPEKIYLCTIYIFSFQPTPAALSFLIAKERFETHPLLVQPKNMRCLLLGLLLSLTRARKINKVLNTKKVNRCIELGYAVGSEPKAWYSYNQANCIHAPNATACNAGLYSTENKYGFGIWEGIQ